MAKGNLFLGQAKGKVGSIVFARAFGQQITRTKPTSVANPKTYAQNVQRAILATVAKEAALLTSIVDHSFANVAYGAESIRHFRKLNMEILRKEFLSGSSNMNLSAKGAGAVPNALKISEGNLPSFASAYQSHVVTFYQNGALENVAEMPVSTFLAAYPYLQGGDQLTLITMIKTAGSLAEGDATFAMKYDRMVFSPDAFNDLDSDIIDDEGYILDAKLDLTKTTNKHMLKAISGGGGNGLGVGDTDTEKIYAAALILSRKVNNVWQRSTQYFEMTEYDDWTDIATAIDSYGAGSSITEETEYLNQAEEGTAASGVSGSYMNAVYDIEGEGATTTPVKAGASLSVGVAGAANTNVLFKGIGFGTGDARVTQVEIYDNNNNLVAHGNQRTLYGSVISAETAGNWKVQTLFWDGTKAVCNMTVSVRA